MGLEELSSLNVKSRYQAFENVTTNGNINMEKSPVSVKRSPSILSKLAKYVVLLSNILPWIFVFFIYKCFINNIFWTIDFSQKEWI